MSIIPEFESRLGEKYRDHLLQINPQTVTRHERTITRIMDYPGYIPGIGTGIGVIRMIGSLFVRIIARIGLALANALGSEKGIRECKYAISRANDEFARGFLEFFPYMTWLSDKHDAENHHDSVSTSAHGKYIYRCDDYPFDTLYSVAPLSIHENEAPLLQPALLNPLPPDLNAAFPIAPAPAHVPQQHPAAAIMNLIHDEEEVLEEIIPYRMDDIRSCGMVAG